VEPTQQLTQIQTDLPDNRVLECAIEAPADYLVTGNKRHFNFTEFEGVKIVDVREFLKAIVPNVVLLL